MNMGLAEVSSGKSVFDLGRVAEKLPAMIAVYNIQSGQYLYVNQSIVKILGYRPEEFIAGGIEFVAGLVHPADLPRVMQENSQAVDAANSLNFLDDDEAFVSFEYRMRHKNGRWVWLQTDGSVYSRDKKGQVESVLNVSMDITDRKTAERRLKAKTLELADLNKSKDEFVAIASHQLRTPATAVKQYLSLLLEGYADPLSPNQKQFAEEAFENNERQLRIVNDILQVARLDLDKVKLNLQRRDVVTKVKSVAAGLKQKFDDCNQKLIIKAVPNSPKVLMDPELMRAVIENILENASKYTPKGRQIEVLFKFSDSSVDVIVRDEGVGIDEADFPKLFQKFSRIDNPLSVEVGGTGLGLYWASRIIELHGGRISVSSQLDRGSTFTISLPIDGPGNIMNDKQEQLKL